MDDVWMTKFVRHKIKVVRYIFFTDHTCVGLLLTMAAEDGYDKKNPVC